MPNPIKPFDAADLKKLLSTTTETFVALESRDWIKDLSSDELEALIPRSDSSLREQIAGHRDTPAGILSRLARDSLGNVRHLVASNPSAPAEALALLARDTTDWVRWRATANPATPAEALALLARDGSEDVRRLVAGNPSTPADTLALLARDTNQPVRWVAAANPGTPAETLALLARDTFEQTRCAAALNPATPAEILTLLARDSNEMVRRAVASNPNTPQNAKYKMCFIATAATGSHDHQITRTLRDFRDRKLETWSAGRGFIQWYYKSSPPVADWIAAKPLMRFTVKWLILFPTAMSVKVLFPASRR
jgi:hypothetical protein